MNDLNIQSQINNNVNEQYNNKKYPDKDISIKTYNFAIKRNYFSLLMILKHHISFQVTQLSFAIWHCFLWFESYLFLAKYYHLLLNHIYFLAKYYHLLLNHIYFLANYDRLIII